METWSGSHYYGQQHILSQGGISISASKMYGHNTYYIGSDKYHIKNDNDAAEFLELSKQEYRRLMKKSYQGFLAGDGRMAFNSVKDAGNAIEVFEAIVLAKTLGGKYGN